MVCAAPKKLRFLEKEEQELKRGTAANKPKKSFANFAVFIVFLEVEQATPQALMEFLRAVVNLQHKVAGKLEETRSAEASLNATDNIPYKNEL